MIEDDDTKDPVDPLATGRGIIFGLVAGAALWLVLIGGIFLYLR